MNKKVFFIGIKGVGMTSLALAMQDAHWQVMGSDTDEVFITDKVLLGRKIMVQPLTSEIPKDLDLVICSSAYQIPDLNIKTLSLAEALAEFVKNRKVIAVSGVGGKTTTSAMLAVLFHSVGRDVGYYVGTSTISGLSAPGALGTDPYYVVEADEYAISKTDPRPKFALLSPKILITTNIIHDHPDIYPSEEDTLRVFSDLIKSIPQSGTWIYNDSDPLTLKILASLNPICHLVPYNLNLKSLLLSVFGDQNQLDAQAAVLAATFAGLTKAEAAKGILAYQGAGRRQEYCGEHKGRLLYDDYAHHPKEIAITLGAFKKKFPNNRIILVFESHTYSRTEALESEFIKALQLADLAFIMPIFESAREKDQLHTITAEKIAKSISKAQAVTWDNASPLIWQSSKPGDIILTMGAGFVYKLHDEFKKL